MYICTYLFVYQFRSVVGELKLFGTLLVAFNYMHISYYICVIISLLITTVLSPLVTTPSCDINP